MLISLQKLQEFHPRSAWIMFRIKEVEGDIEQDQDCLVDFQYHKSHSH